MPPQQQIDDILDHWEEMRLQGHFLTAEELCKHTPDLTPEVSRRLRALKQIDQLLGAPLEQQEASAGQTAVWVEKPREVAREDWPDLPGYVIVNQIGYGGAGVVYRAWQLNLGRTVAVKMLMGHPHPEEVRRLREEARTLAQLQHPNILQVFDVVECRGNVFFTMELAEQGNLLQKLRGGPFSPQAAAQRMIPIARATHAAHQQKIVHRDIKPGNVLLMADGTPKLGDFGLAKHLEQQGDTPSFAVFGTPNYMAPEQAAGKSKQAAPPVDIYALGATFFTLLTGQPPFRGDSKIEVIRKVLEEEPPAPRRLRSSIPPSLEAICCKCLEKQPQRRYPSAEALAQDLENYLAGRPTVARPQRWLARTVRWSRRRPLLWAVAILVLILTVTVPVAAFFADVDRPARALQQELMEGRAVTLIGPDQRPAWHRWPGARGDFLVPRPGEGVALHGQPFTLLELLPDPGVDHFRFAAEVRHDESGFVGGEVGLFFGLRELATPNGKRLYFYYLSFNDLVDLSRDAPPGVPTGNPFGLYPFCRPKEETIPPGPTLKAGSTLCLFPPALAGGGKGPWRRLVVELGLQEVQVSWDGRKAPTFSRTALVQSGLAMLRNEWPGLDLQPENLRLRGGLGVFVYKSEATFRQVRVEPL
jgi:serine/threonine-protein kinase